MTPLEQTGDLTSEGLGLLSDIVGRGWLDAQLEEYQTFRKMHSLPSRWWHRPPKMSPIIPLVYFSHPGPRFFPDVPHGVWSGDPSGILARLLASIVEFKSYWEAIPNRRGWESLAFFLREPLRFYGFKHEVRLATHLKSSGFLVEPLFFNPDAHKGIADIIVKDERATFDVQCKARGPSNASCMPYDLFLYFSGRWARLVSDANQSYYLLLDIKLKLNDLVVDELLDSVSHHLTDKPGQFGRIEHEIYDAAITPLGNLKGQTPPEKLISLRQTAKGRILYSDYEHINQDTPKSVPVISGYDVYGVDTIRIEDFLFHKAREAAEADDRDNPLIISVNMYQEVELNKYLNSPGVKKKYTTRVNHFFNDYPNVAMLIFSSNWDKYIEVQPDRFALGTQYMAIESPRWENVLPKFK